MSRDGRIELDWADGTYSFRLAWGQLAELQEKTDAGPFVVLSRLHSGQWRIEDISHTVRLGLIGGGLEPVKALALVRTYVENRPAGENLPFARAILSAAIFGVKDEPVGEGNAANQVESNLMISPTES